MKFFAPVVVLAYFIGASAAPAAARHMIYPRFTHTHVTKAYLYVDAAERIMEDIRVGSQGAHGARALNGRSLQSLSTSETLTVRRALAQPARLSARTWRSLPRPKPFFGNIAVPRRNGRIRTPQGTRRTLGAPPATPTPTANQIIIQEIGMGRYDDQDCTLYPYVFTLYYDATTGALSSETAALATPAQSSAASLPRSINAC
jgi:hypothetical protein